MMRARPLLFPLLALVSACTRPAPVGAPAPRGSDRPALLVSFDALNERRALGTVEDASIPTFRRFFSEASCTDGARPMFPSVTAAGHAALWTGTWGHTNGASANSVQPLPWADHALTDTRSGYEARQLRAEPLWVTAARAGKAVVGHGVTQSPQHGGRFLPEGGRDESGVQRDSLALRSRGVFVLNGYNRRIAPPQLITVASHRPHPAPAWEGLRAEGLPPMEISWRAGRDSLHALITGRAAYTTVRVNRVRRLAGAIAVPLASVDSAPPAGRDLARRFSEVLWLPQQNGRAGAYFRLWALAPDLSSATLFQSQLNVLEANHPDLLVRYEDAVGGFAGNSASGLFSSGAFGPMLQDGGDGTAELRYLETVELNARQMMRGTDWTWRTQQPALHMDYDPILDDLDHLWLGAVSAEAPGSTPQLRARVNAMRSRGWAVADQRLAQYRRLADERGALLVVSGDHGMRPTWRSFNVNVALRDAGLLVTDSTGRIIAAESDVFSPAGYWVSVNRRRYKDGRVDEARVAALLDSAERVIRGARGADGRPIVTRTWRPVPADTLGIGGPTGGDLYFDLAPGYSLSGRTTGPLVSAARRPSGSHGFPSVDDDMQTVLCAVGPGVGGRRLPRGRLIDAAPTVADWLGIAPPADASGRSLLTEMQSTH